MQEKIAKAVDIAMAVKLQGQINIDQVKHMIDTILKCTLSKIQASQAIKLQDHRKAMQPTLPTNCRQ